MRRILLALIMVLLCSVAVSATTFVTSTADIGISDTSRIKVSMLNQDPDPAEPGQMVTVRFKAENFGAVDVADVDFRLLDEFPFKVVAPADGVVNLGNLYGRQIDEYAMTLEWKILIDEDAAEGENDIRLEYIGPTGDWVRLSPFTIDVESHDAIIDVSKIVSTPERVSSGNEVELAITLQNKADSLVKDIETTLTLGDNFAPLGSGTTKTVRDLEKGETQTVMYKVIVDKDAESKVHSFPLKITYMDELGNEYETEMDVGLVVDNPPRYVLNLEETDIRTKGKKGKVVVSFSDVGFSDINFVRLTLEESDDFELLSSPLVYLGNVEPDDFQTAEFEIFVPKAEEGEESEKVDLNFVIEYTDDYNREKKDEQTLSFAVYSDDDALTFGFKEQENKAAPFIGAMVGILLLVFWLRMLLHAFKSGHPKGTKIMWLFVIISTVIVGALLYYLFGRKVQQ